VKPGELQPDPGRCSLSEEGAKYINELGLEGQVEFAEVELSNAVPALKNGQNKFSLFLNFPCNHILASFSLF
jgi:hypothetical protein